MPGEVLPDYQQQVDLLKRSSVEPRPIVLCHEGTVGQAGAVEGRSSTPTLDDENEVPATADKDDDEEQQIILARRKRKNEKKRLSRQLKNRLKETITTLVSI